MKDTMSKIVRGCSALALVAVMPLAGATMASADENTPAQAAITKVLRVPTGVSLPSTGITYKFKIEAVSAEGNANDTNFGVPGGGEVSINVTSSSAYATVSGTPGYTTYTAQSGSLFSTTAGGLFENRTWPRAGVYVYKITEQQSASWTPATGVTEELWFSQAEYVMSVSVENGAQAGSLYVSAIATERTKTDTGDTPSSTEKVVSTPGDGSSTFSGLAFTNGYSLIADPTLPTDPTKGYAASVTKMVAGVMADQTRYFDFEVTLSVPAVNQTADKTYKAYVVNATTGASEITDANKGTGATITPGTSTDPAYFEFKSGEVKNIKLKHYQRLAFVGLPYTSSVDVTEAGVDNYEATAVTSTDGSDDEPGNQPSACTVKKACSASLTGISAAKKALTYTNTRQDTGGTTPTGMDLDDAAYWVMIVLAGAALIGFVIIRVRKSKRAQA